MVATVNAALLGTGRKISVARGIAISTLQASAGGDLVTVNHQLGVCPEQIQWTPRSVVTATSGGVPQVLVLSWDATKVVLCMPGDGTTNLNVQGDLWCDAAHTISR